MAKRRQSAHDQLAELRQAAVADKVHARDIETELQAAGVAIEDAAAEVAEAYADGDEQRVAQAREAGEQAHARADDLRGQLAGGRLRVERSQQQLDGFQRDHARDLLDEREPVAREVAEQLTRAGHELIRLHHAYAETRADIDRLLSNVPGATVRSDGAPGSHAWESVVKRLEHAIRETPEVDAPLPQWHGVESRKVQDSTARLLKARREGDQRKVEELQT